MSQPCECFNTYVHFMFESLYPLPCLTFLLWCKHSDVSPLAFWNIQCIAIICGCPAGSFKDLPFAYFGHYFFLCPVFTKYCSFQVNFSINMCSSPPSDLIVIVDCTSDPSWLVRDVNSVLASQVPPPPPLPPPPPQYAVRDLQSALPLLESGRWRWGVSAAGCL